MELICVCVGACVFANMAFIMYSVKSYIFPIFQFLPFYCSPFSPFMLNSQAAGMDKAF